MSLTLSAANPNKKSRWLLGKPLCSHSCRLCPYNVMLRLPSSQPPSRLCRCLTHSSRGPFPCPELFLPSARKMNQCLALPINARELLPSRHLSRDEQAAQAPSLPHCPCTLPHLTVRQLKSRIHSFSLCPTAFSRPRQLGSPGSSAPAQAISGQAQLKCAHSHNISPSSPAGAGHQIPEQETSCL